MSAEPEQAPAAVAEQPDEPMVQEAVAKPAADPETEAAPAADATANGAAAPPAEDAPKAADQPAGEAEAAKPLVQEGAEGDKQPLSRRERSRERSRSRSRDRRRDDRDRDGKARSRSRSRDRRRSRSRSRDRRRRSRSRSRSRSGERRHRTRRSRFEEESEEEREERRKKAAAAAAAASALPGAAGAADPLAALRAANPALAGLDSSAAALVMRQQMMLQQQLLLQQQAALQAQQVMSKAVKAAPVAPSAAQRLQEKQLKAQRELFVGNLAPGMVTEQSLYQVFHSALIAAFPQAAQPGQEPVLKVNITGRFAFVEFRHPEYATAALQLNGQIALMGNTLKIARPSSYVEAPQMGGGLPGMGAAPMAPAMPGMFPGPPSMPGGMPGAMPGAALPGAAMPGAAMPAAVALPDALATSIPTPFLGVNGMVTADVLASDTEYSEVLGDLQQECSRYGAVVGLKVPRPPHGTGAAQLIGTGYFGKAFVQFADIPSAQRAKDAITGRMFAGTIVQAYHIAPPTYQAVPEASAA